MIKKLILSLGLVCFLHQAQASDKAIIATVYDIIINNHLTPVTVEELAVSGLQSLHDIDKNLTFSAGKDMVYLYYKQRQVALWHKPKQADDVKQWAEIADKTVEKAVKISPAVARKQEEIVERIFFSSVDALDDHSRYYFAEEPDQETESEQVAINFNQGILYIKIKVFGLHTPVMIKNALNRYPNARAIILDLRGNPGGQLNAAIETAKIFIDDGIITSTKSRAPDSAKYYVSNDSHNINLPIAVLIDKDTASSAEMLTAALKEQIQAIVVGTLSYGKGTIQDTYIFDNGGRLALTTAEFFTPSGKPIEKIGIVPDHCILNDQVVPNDKCKSQRREGRDFDIEFAGNILNQHLGDQN